MDASQFHLMPIPLVPSSSHLINFLLLTDAEIIHALACQYPRPEAKTLGHALLVIDLTSSCDFDGLANDVGLFCENSASAVSKVPQSAHSVTANFMHDYLSFLQYDLSQLVEYNSIAIFNIDYDHNSFAIVEFSEKPSISLVVKNSIIKFFYGIHVTLSSLRPMIVDISYKSVWSSLLAFKASITPAGGRSILFRTFIRHFSGHNYDSKYYMNFQNWSVLDISVFAVAPFSPFGIS
jgi:hypothetical protein